MSSPVAAPGPPCGRRGASLATARMMTLPTLSEALSLPDHSDTEEEVRHHQLELVMQCPVFTQIRHTVDDKMTATDKPSQ